MFKITVSSERLFRRLSKNSILSRLVRADPRLLQVIRDPELTDRIISSFVVDGARISKETVAGRFRDLDGILTDQLRGVAHPVIHDAAVSSGTTSLELLNRLRAEGISPRLYISEKFARCLHVQRGPVARLYDEYGSLLYAHIGIVSADPLSSWRFPVSRLLFRALAAKTPRMTDAAVHDILLYDRSVRDALESGALTHLDYDIFVNAVDIRFDVVRCMNTITSMYFSPERIAQGVANLRRSLKPCGLLLLGRTLPSGRNNATFFRLKDDCFVPERVVNDGADIHDIVVGLVPQSSASPSPTGPTNA
jgi:hypothetical protein